MSEYNKNDNEKDPFNLDDIESLDDDPKSPDKEWDDSFIRSEGKEPVHENEFEPKFDPEFDMPEWEKGFDPKSFEVPDFPVTLKPRLNKVYELTIKDFPSEPVKTSIGPAFVMEVYNEKMVNSLFINRSTAFSLAKIRRSNHWKTKDLIGKKILLQCIEGKKDGKDTRYITIKLLEFQ